MVIEILFNVIRTVRLFNSLGYDRKVCVLIDDPLIDGGRLKQDNRMILHIQIVLGQRTRAFLQQFHRKYMRPVFLQDTSVLIRQFLIQFIRVDLP